MKKLRYFCEAILLHFLFFIFRVLPLDRASGLGGWIGRRIGPRLATSRKAARNLSLALPDYSETERKKIIADMWDNLGRVIAEYPHMEKIARERVTFTNPDILRTLKNSDKPGIIFGAHLGNWEIGSPSFFLQHDLPVHLVYRKPNNPFIDKTLENIRTLKGKLTPMAKSRQGTRQLVKTLQDGACVGILIDQKYNEGIAVPFFNHPAMTSPAFVQLAQKFDAPLIPGRFERLDGAHFRITFFEPLDLFDKDGTPLPAENVIRKAHDHLETWIKDKPGQWLWLHRRWPGDVTEKTKEENNAPI